MTPAKRSRPSSLKIRSVSTPPNKLKDDLDKFIVDGGARWQNTVWQDIYNSPRYTTEEFSQKPYWVVDLMIPPPIQQKPVDHAQRE